MSSDDQKAMLALARLSGGVDTFIRIRRHISPEISFRKFYTVTHETESGLILLESDGMGEIDAVSVAFDIAVAFPQAEFCEGSILRPSGLKPKHRVLYKGKTK